MSLEYIFEKINFQHRRDIVQNFVIHRYSMMTEKIGEKRF